MDEFAQAVLLPLGLGLVGAVEPCSIGSALIFLKLLEGRQTWDRAVQLSAFIVTRGLFVGALGAVAALAGQAFLPWQRAGWLILGALYVLLGIVYLSGTARILMRSLGPQLSASSSSRSSIGLGLLFGLNIPACAAPLLIALLGGAAIGEGSLVAAATQGFGSLALFGFALSWPLAVAVAVPWFARRIDTLVAIGKRAPKAIGIVFLVLGLWSIYFGLFVTLPS